MPGQFQQVRYTVEGQQARQVSQERGSTPSLKGNGLPLPCPSVDVTLAKKTGKGQQLEGKGPKCVAGTFSQW